MDQANTTVTTEELDLTKLTDKFHTPRTAAFYATLALLSLFSLFGVVGNTLVIWVFKRKRDKLLSTFFIIVLAIIDLTTCLVVIPFTIIMEAIEFDIKIDIICKIYYFLITFNIPLSVLVIVAIAVDRYFCICHPFTQTLNERQAKVLVIVMTTCASVLGVLTALTYGVPHPNDQDGSFLNTTLVNSHGLFSFRLFETPEGTITSQLVHYDHCKSSALIFSERFRQYYQAVYACLYLLCLLVVVVLYLLIYQAVLVRRRRRQKQRSAFSVTTAAIGGVQLNQSRTDTTAARSTEIDVVLDVPLRSCDEKTEESSRKAASVTDQGNHLKVPEVKTKGREEHRSSTQMETPLNRDSYWVANLKTAAVLFVVTLVFVITYLPAFLMIHDILTYNVFIFYMYFANNISNPLIYAFMNKNFREDLVALLWNQRITYRP